MGMDVYGLNPENKTGEYFRNNVWYWRPLWNYCLTQHSVAGKVEQGHSNSGDGLNAEDSLELGLALLNDVTSGKAYEYQQAYRKHISELPLEECKLCNGTGVREDKVGTESGMPSKLLAPEKVAVLNREIGWCNGCDGEGEVVNFAAHYPFDVENVLEFAHFLINCGGFTIC